MKCHGAIPAEQELEILVYLPELELPEIFDESELTAWTQQITAPWLRTKVSRELDKLLTEARRSGG